MKKLILIILFYLSYNFGFSQNSEFDSLRSLLVKNKADTSQIMLNIRLSRKYRSVNLDSCIYYAQQGQQLASLVKNDSIEFNALMMLGGALSEQDIPKSMQVYHRALQIAEKNKVMRAMAYCYRSIGLLHLYLGNDNLYIDYLKKAKKIFSELDLTSEVAICNGEIGGVYTKNYPDSARFYLTSASKDSLIMENPYNLYYWGKLETDLNPEKARTYFYKSLKISNENQGLRGISLASRWFSILFEKQGQLDSSIIVAKSGLSAAEKLNFPRGIIFNSAQLNTVYNKLNQTDSAYKYLTIKTAAKENLLSQDKVNQIQTAIIEEQQRVQKLEEEQTAVQNKIKFYASLAVLFVVLSFAIFFFINQRKIKKANLLLLNQSDEIKEKNEELKVSLDHLKATQSQLIQSEKMASLGELTAGIAHEIQNPLNFVNNFSEVSNELIKEIQEERGKKQEERDEALTDEILVDIEQNLEKINHHGKRAGDIVKGMLQHSRVGSDKKEPTDINALADEYLRLAYHGLRAKDKSFNADFKTDLAPDLPKVNVVPQDIGRVLLNLINNAFYAVKEADNPKVIITSRLIPFPGGASGGSEVVEITVKDNGSGIPEQIKEKIFQPFFTTKPTGSGTGLGLSLSYDIVKAHGGELSVETKEGEGSEFVIKLPFRDQIA